MILEAVNAHPLLGFVIDGGAQYRDGQLLRHVLLLRDREAADVLRLPKDLVFGDVILDGSFRRSIFDRIALSRK